MMDLWNVLVGWSEKVFGMWRDQTTADLRIADRARLLRRELEASFENWPTGPDTLNELTTWAGGLLRGFGATEPALKDLVDLRATASRRVRRAVGTARDEYYAAADVINRLFKGGGLSIQWDERPAVEAQLRTAFAHLRGCIVALRAAGAERK